MILRLATPIVRDRTRLRKSRSLTFPLPGPLRRIRGRRIMAMEPLNG
jgi:hypothetical protein